MEIGSTGRIVRRWPTGKIAERPIKTKRVARIGLIISIHTALDDTAMNERQICCQV